MATVSSIDDSMIKKIVVSAGTGTAAGAAAGGEIKRRKTRRSRQQEGGTGSSLTANSPVIVNKIPAPGEPGTPGTIGGGATSPGTMQQLAASHIPGNNSSKAIGTIAPITAAQAAIGQIAPAAVNDPKPVATGGAAVHAPKVTLVKSRKLARRVMLAAATKPHGGVSALKRKTAKKVKVSLSGLGKRLHHAKTIRKGASKKTIEEIKKALLDAKLVKAETKAPEDILRQMYADYMTLKKKAL